MNKYLTIFVITVVLVAAFFLTQQSLMPSSEEQKEEQTVENTAVENIEKENSDNTVLQTSNAFLFTSKYKLTVKNIQDATLSVKIALPQNVEGKQQISDLTYSIQPTHIDIENDNKFAVFEIKNPKSETEITVNGKVKAVTYDLTKAKEHALPQQETNLERYLSEEKLIETNDKEIVSLAKSLESKKSIYETVSNIYSYVQKNLRYSNASQAKGAKATLTSHKGKCTDYSALMIALCRANKIPARIVSGNIISEQGEKHSWVEVYFQDLGWVAFEPTIISNTRPNYAKSPNIYLTTAYNTFQTTIVEMRVTYQGVKKPHLTPVLLLKETTDFMNDKSQ